jgi:predicted transposase/invertase (TIGR01784 family)
MRFVDVKNDVAFRKIFGNDKKTEILISFLNAVLRLESKERIVAITIENPYLLPILPNYKTSILDVKARDGNGKTYIVEMQVADVIGMDQRLLFYTSKEYSQQIISGDKYTELKPVIFIGIFDFDFTENPNYLSHHAICNVETKERVIKDMDFYFIELPKFLKKEDELDNITDKWIYFIKEAENLSVVPDNTDDIGLQAAYTDANQNSWTREALNEYIYAGIREQDERGRREKAIQNAQRIGTAQGIQQGIEQGVELGFAQGMDKKEAQAVIGMYENGVPIPVIAQSLNITIEKVEQIIAQHINKPQTDENSTDLA